MKRTTVMLPERLRMRAFKYAHNRGISLGEFIRKSLVYMIEKPVPIKKDALFSDKFVFKGKAPKDLAKNHDDYLY